MKWPELFLVTFRKHACGSEVELLSFEPCWKSKDHEAPEYTSSDFLDLAPMKRKIQIAIRASEESLPAKQNALLVFVYPSVLLFPPEPALSQLAGHRGGLQRLPGVVQVEGDFRHSPA